MILWYVMHLWCMQFCWHTGIWKRMSKTLTMAKENNILFLGKTGLGDWARFSFLPAFLKVPLEHSKGALECSSFINHYCLEQNHRPHLKDTGNSCYHVTVMFSWTVDTWTTLLLPYVSGRPGRPLKGLSQCLLGMLPLLDLSYWLNSKHFCSVVLTTYSFTLSTAHCLNVSDCLGQLQRW